MSDSKFLQMNKNLKLQVRKMVWIINVYILYYTKINNQLVIVDLQTIKNILNYQDWQY